ncbi:MAG TPA: acetamidase/formamidase family protein [Opitutaceae bacterium]|nr:acetamidase/formamidase family protein [Opitutaceae bacterium]
MKCRRAVRAAAAAVALAGFAVALTAAPYSVNYHLRSVPENMVSGYFSADTPPVLKIKSGEIVEIDTISGGGARDDDPTKFFKDNGIPLDLEVVQDILAIKKAVPPSGIRGHMMTGPIFVEGAMPGDTLEVRILDIKSRAPYGINSGRPGSGGIPDAVPRPYAKVIKFDLERNVALFAPGIEIPLRQFQGVMGIAPAKERGKLSSTPPYPDIGGNFDNKYLGKGATLYLPVQTEGALFQTGDPHAAQGNGEISITAIESSNTVTMQFIVRKDLPIKVARAETPTHYICMGLDVELNVAMRMAIMQTLEFLKEKKGLDFFDALALGSVGVDFEVTQVVDQTKGIHAMIPKSIFVKDSDASTYWFNPASGAMNLAVSEPAPAVVAANLGGAQ